MGQHKEKAVKYYTPICLACLGNYCFFCIIPINFMILHLCSLVSMQLIFQTIYESTPKSRSTY